jgi:hypothetical protein
MTANSLPGRGDAWQELVAELQQRLRERDPHARVQATIDPSGLLRLDVATTGTQRAAAQRLARRYEERARSTCERCGDRVAAVGPGPVVTVLCARCRPDA